MVKCVFVCAKFDIKIFSYSIFVSCLLDKFNDVMFVIIKETKFQTHTFFIILLIAVCM